MRLDAELDARLLEGVFFPNSPLHDKAVIVRNRRIVAASCTLPLAGGQGTARLGTRHRAALGVSESTDAIAIVVSEETGAISIATDGRLVPLREEAGIRTEIEALLSGRNGLRPTARAS